MSVTTTSRPRLATEEEVFEQAAPKAKRQPLPIEVRCYSPEGYELRLLLELPIDELPEALKRLQALGYSSQPPQQERHTARAATSRPARAGRAAPAYADDGTPLCPTHQRPLRGPNQWGKLYCTHKEGAEYCNYATKAE